MKIVWIFLLLAGCTYRVPYHRTPVVAPFCLFACDIRIEENDTNTDTMPSDQIDPSFGAPPPDMQRDLRKGDYHGTNEAQSKS